MAILVGRVWSSGFPLATLVVNVLGSILMGVLVGSLARLLPPHQEELRLFLAVGILGGFTTFSSFSLDAVVLMQRGAWWEAGGYVLLSVVLCLVGLYLGLQVTRGGI